MQPPHPLILAALILAALADVAPPAEPSLNLP